MKKLTKKQIETIDFIQDYINLMGHSPTRHEIADGLGININAAQERVIGLIKKGALTQVDGAARTIKPVGGFSL
jgi:SOS-response transcriptional repressor LexA